MLPSIKRKISEGLRSTNKQALDTVTELQRTELLKFIKRYGVDTTDLADKDIETLRTESLRALGIL